MVYLVTLLFFPIKYGAWAIWDVLCFVFLFVIMSAYLVAIIAMHAWDFKYHKYTWSDFTNSAESNWESNGQKSPLASYKKWISFE